MTNSNITWSTGVGNPNLHMDALEGGSISRACSKLGIICAMKTKALNLLKNGIDIIALFIKLRLIDLFWNVQKYFKMD